MQKYKEMRGCEAYKHLNMQPRDFYRAVDAGKYEDNGKSGTKRRFKIPINAEEIEETIDLKEKHLEIKIKKEQQLLYEHRLVFIDKAKDVFLQEFYLPVIVRLTELIRQHSTKDLADKWNQTISDISQERQNLLQQALQSLVLE